MITGIAEAAVFGLRMVIGVALGTATGLLMVPITLLIVLCAIAPSAGLVRAVLNIPDIVRQTMSANVRMGYLMMMMSKRGFLVIEMMRNRGWPTIS